LTAEIAEFAEKIVVHCASPKSERRREIGGVSNRKSHF